MARVLNSNVVVEGRWYRKGQSVDEVGDAASRIGDHAWEEAESGASAKAAPPPPAPKAVPADAGVTKEVDVSESGEVVDPKPMEAAAQAQVADVEGRDALAEDGGSGAGEQLPSPPPRSGRGSSEDAWRKYAEQVGVDVSEAEGRDGVVAFVEAAGKPV